MEQTILNVEGLNAANYNMLVELMEYYKANARGRAASISLPGLSQKITEVLADHIVVSCGYISNNELYKKIKGENVYLLGDAEKLGNLMSAIWKAYETAITYRSLVQRGTDFGDQR